MPHGQEKLAAYDHICILAASALAGDVEDRVVHSALVLREITGMKEKGIPSDLLNKCACVIVIPNMLKGGFIGAGNYGRGAMSCRLEQGEGPGAHLR